MIHALVCSKKNVHMAFLCEHKRPRRDMIEKHGNLALDILVFEDTEYNKAWEDCIRSPYIGKKPKYCIKENKLVSV